MTFYKGTSIEQDGRFINKDKKLIDTLEFPEEYKETVNIHKINLDIIKSWIDRKLNDILGFEDECISGYIINQLQETEELINPKKLQYSLTGFLESNTYDFMKEFWNILLSAQKAPDGIPAELIEDKKKEIIDKTQKKKERLKFLDDLLGSNAIEKNDVQRKQSNGNLKSYSNNENKKREVLSSSSSSPLSQSRKDKEKKSSHSRHYHHHHHSKDHHHRHHNDHHHRKHHNHYDDKHAKDKSTKQSRSRSRSKSRDNSLSNKRNK